MNVWATLDKGWASTCCLQRNVMGFWHHVDVEPVLVTFISLGVHG